MAKSTSNMKTQSIMKSQNTMDKEMEPHEKHRRKDSHHDPDRKHHHHHSSQQAQIIPRPKASSVPITNPDYDLVDSIYPFTMRDINGRPVSLKKYEGHVCILVNVASKSGFAEFNYKVLNSLFKKYSDSLGLRILAFPCEQFNNSEFILMRDLKRFVEKKGVKFDMFSKISINCKNTHPLWRFMKTTVENTSNKHKLVVITEPFTKFLVSRTGLPTARLGPEAKEEAIYEALEPLFEPENELVVKKTSLLQANLPPPIEEEDLPCMRSWHFEPGILKLI